MADKREQILERLQAVAGGVVGVVTSERNHVDFSDSQLPAVSVLEGDESTSESDDGRGRPPSRPYIVTMLPQVFIRARQDDVKIGTRLNTLRSAIVKSVLADAELLALTKDGSSIRYNGLESTLHAGRSMIGASALVFSITYVLIPSDL